MWQKGCYNQRGPNDHDIQFANHALHNKTDFYTKITAGISDGQCYFLEQKTILYVIQQSVQVQMSAILLGKKSLVHRQQPA
jgi:hypothetical protein